MSNLITNSTEGVIGVGKFNECNREAFEIRPKPVQAPITIKKPQPSDDEIDDMVDHGNRRGLTRWGRRGQSRWRRSQISRTSRKPLRSRSRGRRR